MKRGIKLKIVKHLVKYMIANGWRPLSVNDFIVKGFKELEGSGRTHALVRDTLDLVDLFPNDDALWMHFSPLTDGAFNMPQPAVCLNIKAKKPADFLVSWKVEQDKRHRFRGMTKLINGFNLMEASRCPGCGKIP